MVSFTTALRERFYRLSQLYPGYEEPLTQALFGLVAREHILWLSKPGRAKSEVARAIFNMFDARVFSTQINKDMMPDDLFGDAVLSRQYETGERIYNTQGGLAEAEFAYLDEFFDGTSFLRRSMLTAFNERLYERRNMGSIAIPLHSAFMTTNFMGQHAEDEAVLDRILCKAWVPGITNVVDCMRAGKTYLSNSHKRPELEKLDYEGLLDLSLFVKKPVEEGGVTISPGMQLLHMLLVEEFQRRRIEAAKIKWHTQNPNAAEEPSEEALRVPDISPRTLVKLYDMSRASAALNDRATVQAVDNRALGYGLYIIGDSSGDARLWRDLCDEFLGLSSRELKSLESFGAMGEAIGVIGSERAQTTKPELQIGGRLVSTTRVGLQGFLDSLRGSNAPVLRLAKKKLADELRSLSDRGDGLGFNLLEGWQ